MGRKPHQPGGEVVPLRPERYFPRRDHVGERIDKLSQQRDDLKNEDLLVVRLPSSIANIREKIRHLPEAAYDALVRLRDATHEHLVKMGLADPDDLDLSEKEDIPPSAGQKPSEGRRILSIVDSPKSVGKIGGSEYLSPVGEALLQKFLLKVGGKIQILTSRDSAWLHFVWEPPQGKPYNFSIGKNGPYLSDENGQPRKGDQNLEILTGLYRSATDFQKEQALAA